LKWQSASTPETSQPDITTVLLGISEGQSEPTAETSQPDITAVLLGISEGKSASIPETSRPDITALLAGISEGQSEPTAQRSLLVPNKSLREWEQLAEEQRTTSRRESAFELERKLVKLKEFEDGLRKEEILSSRTKSRQYFKEALLTAKESLDAAYSCLTREALYHRRLSREQIIGTITALQDSAWWDSLLEGHKLASNEAARAAARDLAARVATLDPDKVSAESLTRLLGDIDSLRNEVTTAIRQADGLLSPGLIRQCLTAAYNVTSQVMVGLVAASATAEAAGAKVVPEVIYSAVGLTVASSMAEIIRRTSLRYRAQTCLAQLQKYHHQLIEAVEDLATFLSWLTESGPAADVALDTVRSTCLAAGFLISHVEQLSLALTWPERGEYRDVLRATRTALDVLRRFTDGQCDRDIENVQRAQQELRGMNARLDSCSHIIDGLKPTRGLA